MGVGEGGCGAAAAAGEGEGEGEGEEVVGGLMASPSLAETCSPVFI